MDYLVYKNEKLPIRISYYAIKEFQKESKKTLESLADFENFEPLCYYGLLSGHHKEGKNFPYNRDEVSWILDDNFEAFMDILRNSFVFDGGKKSAVMDEAKKK